FDQDNDESDGYYVMEELMLGAIIGDTVGTRYEWKNHKSKNFELFHRSGRFSDDSVCTMAVAETLLDHCPIDYSQKGLEAIKKDLVKNFIGYVKAYPDVGYGGRFYEWATGKGDRLPYNSWGNGSAMRISPVGWIANSEEEVMKLAKAVSEVTHNHPEGIKGAQATAMCIFMARQGKNKEEIKDYIYDHFYPILDYLDYDELVKTYKFDVSCQGSVPEAVYCFLIGNSFEDALRTAVSIGGDTDTIACMAGSIAEAFYQNEDTEKLFRQFMSMDYLSDQEKQMVERFNKQIKKDDSKRT
ncbi:MAG: ADP-ribosylglycohydrolase family protein, partial [Erysipelotrichaceae bacterium]|nr:ADP-ribosylglycohydrolase family protein [Erysipelotrichaceae bacterium]